MPRLIRRHNDLGIVSSSLPYFSMNVASSVLALNSTNTLNCITNGHSSLLAKPVDFSTENLSDASIAPLAVPGDSIFIFSLFYSYH